MSLNESKQRRKDGQTESKRGREAASGSSGDNMSDSCPPWFANFTNQQLEKEKRLWDQQCEVLAEVRKLSAMPARVEALETASNAMHQEIKRLDLVQQTTAEQV